MAIDNKDKKVLKSSIEREQNEVACSAECEKIKGSKNLNVPHLRFPEFTEEWVNVSLKDVADFQKERISSGLLDESTYISTENILQNFQGVQSAISIPANTNVVAYKKNDILLSNIRPYLKKVWFSDRIGGCSADVFVLRSKTCEPEFLYNVIASDKFINYVMSGAKGVKMPRGDKNQMESFSFSIPAVVEQRKISRLFQLLDERIVTQNKIIEKLQSLIKGLRVCCMQRVYGNNVYLSEIAQIYQPQTISSTELTEDGFLVYGANGIIGKYKDYNHETEQICITCRGNTCGMVNYTKPMSWITGNAMVINTDKYQDKVCKRYLYHYLSAYNFNSIISGSGQPQIVRTPLEKLKITLPTISEQKQKAIIFDKIQDKIDINHKVLNLYIGQKQYLLRQMFI